METQEHRLVGDSYSADPEELRLLRELATEKGVSKAELIRKAIRELLVKESKLSVLDTDLPKRVRLPCNTLNSDSSLY